MNTTINVDTDNARYIDDLIQLMPVVADAIATAITAGKSDEAAIEIAMRRLHTANPVLPLRRIRPMH